MHSDEVVVSLADIAPALNLIERTARYIGFDEPYANQLRLLGEELILSAKDVLDDLDGKMFMDTDAQNMRIHLVLEGRLSFSKREQLIALSKESRNEPPKGLFKKLSAFFDDVFMENEEGYVPMMYYGEGYTGHYYEYSLMSARDSIPASASPVKPATPMELDGVERNILQGIADDVIVSAHGKSAELIVIKKLP